MPRLYDRHAVGDAALEVGHVLHWLAVDRGHHVAWPQEAAGIGAGLDLQHGDAIAPFDQAELVGHGRRHVDHGGTGEWLTAFELSAI